MFADASAIVAILTAEPEADAMMGAIGVAAAPVTSSLAIYEAVLAIHRKRSGLAQAQEDVETFLKDTGTEITPITAEHARLALDAHARFGKGTGHPAKLNMGDCFSYAVAKSRGCTLLFKGHDFTRTDIRSATP